MATINIANLTFTHKGNYDGSTAYVKNDVVYYATNGNAYIAKQGTTGNVPTNGTYWSQFAAGSGGIWNAGLSIGSAGQQLRVNSGGNALEFATIAGGAFGQFVFAEDNTNYANSNQSTYVRATNTKIDITPSSASKTLFVCFNFGIRTQHSDSSFEHRIIRIIGGSETVLKQSTGSFSYHYHGSSQSGNWYRQQPYFFTDTPNTTSQVTYTVEFRNPHRTDQVHLNESIETQMMAYEIN